MGLYLTMVSNMTIILFVKIKIGRKEEVRRVVIKGVVIVMSALMIVLCALSPLQEKTIKAAKKPKLNKTKVELEVGDSAKLKLSNAKKVKWSSSKKRVATVSQKGVVKAKKKGKAIISAKYKKKAYKCRVTVEDKVINVAVPTATEAVEPTTASPTPIPITTPTVTPTEPPIIINKSEQNLNILKECILKSEYTNVDNNHFIQIERDGYQFAIIYEKTNDRFLFMTIGTTTVAESGTTMYVALKDNNILYPEYIIVFTDSGNAFKAKTEINAKTYNRNTEAYFSLIEGTDGVTENNIQSLSNSELKLSFSGWDLLLLLKTNMQLSDIGFDLFNR